MWSGNCYDVIKFIQLCKTSQFSQVFVCLFVFFRFTCKWTTLISDYVEGFCKFKEFILLNFKILSDFSPLSNNLSQASGEISTCMGQCQKSAVNAGDLYRENHRQWAQFTAASRKTQTSKDWTGTNKIQTQDRHRRSRKLSKILTAFGKPEMFPPG